MIRARPSLVVAVLAAAALLSGTAPGPAEAGPGAVPGAEAALAWVASAPSNPRSADGEWDLYCLALVDGAWRQAGHAFPELAQRNARLAFDELAAGSVVHDQDREPAPRGALVFWDWVSGGVDYGHVAIANGDGTCATTCPRGKGYGAGSIRTSCPLRAFAHLHRLGWIDPITRK